MAPSFCVVPSSTLSSLSQTFQNSLSSHQHQSHPLPPRQLPAGGSQGPARGHPFLPWIMCVHRLPGLCPAAGTVCRLLGVHKDSSFSSSAFLGTSRAPEQGRVQGEASAVQGTWEPRGLGYPSLPFYSLHRPGGVMGAEQLHLCFDYSRLPPPPSAFPCASLRDAALTPGPLPISWGSGGWNLGTEGTVHPSHGEGPGGEGVSSSTLVCTHEPPEPPDPR